MGHCFKYPGEYKTNLTAWKDNKVIFRHQLAVTITDEKDFLEYNWKDITKTHQHGVLMQMYLKVVLI